MKMSRSIRIGMIGAGAITQTRHLPGFKKIPGVQLVAVCNRSELSSKRVAKQWGFERVAHSPIEIIRASDIDAVVIGAWPYLHQKLSCATLSAGKHVFTQARMARNLSEARHMVAVARKHPSQVAMICPSPYAMKSALFIQELLHNGFFGEIRLVHFQSLNSFFADPKALIHWRQQDKFNGINTLNLGIILERFLQWFGPIRFVQAIGTIFTPWRRNQDGKRVRVTNADQLQVIASFRNHPGHMTLSLSSAVHHAPSDFISIYGSQGTLTVNLSTDQVEGATVKSKSLKEFNIPRHLQRTWNVESDFIDAIRAGGRHRLSKERSRFFPPDFDEGLRYMAATEAVIRATRSGKKEETITLK